MKRGAASTPTASPSGARRARRAAEWCSRTHSRHRACGHRVGEGASVGPCSPCALSPVVTMSRKRTKRSKRRPIPGLDGSRVRSLIRRRRVRDVVHERAHGRASRTRLKGVSVARRKRENPASVTTSRSRASPACAPSAGPTSCDSEAGMQSSVENRSRRGRPGCGCPRRGRRQRLDDHPGAVGGERLATCRAAPTGSPMSCRQSKWSPGRSRAGERRRRARPRSSRDRRRRPRAARWRAVSIEAAW